MSAMIVRILVRSLPFSLHHLVPLSLCVGCRIWEEEREREREPLLTTPGGFQGTSTMTIGLCKSCQELRERLVRSGGVNGVVKAPGK